MKARWTAIRDGDVDGLLARLGLAQIGDIELDTAEPQLLIMPSGWHVVLEYEWGEADDPEKLADLGGLAITGTCNTISMGSRVRGADWDVDYDCDRAEGQGFKITGTPPADLRALIEKAEAEADEGEDDGVDYRWSVPLNLMQAITGFHLEEDLPSGTRAVHLKRVSKAPGGGLLKALFGRKS